MLRIAATADESFAAIFERSKFGITIAAMIKMMVTTIRSSTSEKPRRWRTRGDCPRRNADGGSTWGHKLDQPSLVRAEGTHAGRLHSGWSGIHFESVEYAANQKSTRSVEHIAALRIRGDAQEG